MSFLKNLAFFTFILVAGSYANFLFMAGDFSEANTMMIRLFTGTIRVPVFLVAIMIFLAMLKTHLEL